MSTHDDAGPSDALATRGDPAREPAAEVAIPAATIARLRALPCPPGLDAPATADDAL